MNHSVVGGVLVKGSVITSDTELPLLVARSSKLVKELDDRTPGVNLSWLNRDDLTWFDPANRFRGNFGFELNIDSNVFGSGAGKIEIYALTCSGYQPVGSLFQWLKLGKMMDDFSEESRSSLFFKRSVNSLLPQATDRSSLMDSKRSRVLKEADNDTVLFCSHNLNPCEGAPRVLSDVAQRYAQEKGAEKVKIISARDGELNKGLSEKGIEVEVVEELQNRASGWSNYLSGLEQAESLIRKFNPSRVFANTLDSFWAVRLANLLEIDSLWTIHESRSPITFGLNLDSRQRLHFFKALEQVDQSIFVSEASRQVFEQWIDTGKSKVIPNGVDLKLCSAFLEKRSRVDSRKNIGLEDGDHLVLVVGTVTPRKGQDIVLRAAQKLISDRSRKNLRFFFVGGREGEFQDQLFRDCKAWGLGEHVKFVSETSEVGDYYSGADTVVIASREESAPLVSLEAMAWGKPLVSTSVFGLAEQLEGNQTALLFESGDSEGLVRAIERLLEDPSFGQTLAENAQSTARARFDINKTIEAYTAILSDG
jgi:glycosyltransferase involved in cell wall biosynthesis